MFYRIEGMNGFQRLWHVKCLPKLRAEESFWGQSWGRLWKTGAASVHRGCAVTCQGAYKHHLLPVLEAGSPRAGAGMGK